MRNADIKLMLVSCSATIPGCKVVKLYRLSPYAIISLYLIFLSTRTAIASLGTFFCCPNRLTKSLMCVLELKRFDLPAALKERIVVVSLR